MKWLMSLIFLGSFYLTVSGQDKHAVDFTFGPDYNYFISGDENPAGIIDVHGSRRRLNPAVGWKVGAMYNRKIAESFIIRSGLRIAQSKLKSDLITGIMWGSEHDGNGGFEFDPSLPHEMQTFFSFSFLEFPVSLRYEFEQNTLKTFIEAGVSPLLFLNASTKEVTDIDSNVIDYHDDFHKVYFVLMFSGGFSYSISDKLNLFCQPSFRYHLRDIGKHVTSSAHLYSLGLELGVRKPLK